MKNKKATYILLSIVAAIWGIIVYKIFSTVGSKESIQQENISYSSMLPVKTAIDTFSIIANYRDPFLGKMTLSPSENDKPKTSVKKIEKPAPEPLKWPSIVYRGMIKNQKTGKQLYLLTIDKQDNMMKPGEMISDIELKRVYRDSVEVVFKKEKRTIKK